MADLNKLYRYNEELANEGAKMFVGEGEDEYILVGRYDNEAYIMELGKVLQANKRKLEELEGTPEYAALDKELTAEVRAKALVIGFGAGVTMNGKPIPNDWKTRKQILMQPGSDLQRECVKFSMDDNNYPPEIDVEDVKKS